MYCQCGSRTVIKDTRDYEDGVWRRHECKACGQTFNTLEQRTTITTGAAANFHYKKRGVVIKPRKKQAVAPLEKYALAKPKAPDAPLEKSARRKIEDLRYERELKKLEE
jgi:transcriptional regulator NrdR family protein